MSKSSSKFPLEVRACLWSYRPEDLDIERDQREIITQVLNYGTWDAVKWLWRTYGENELKEVLKKPARGRWFKQSLNFWLLQLGLKIPEDLYKKAIFNIHPTKL